MCIHVTVHIVYEYIISVLYTITYINLYKYKNIYRYNIPWTEMLICEVEMPWGLESVTPPNWPKRQAMARGLGLPRPVIMLFVFVFLRITKYLDSVTHTEIGWFGVGFAIVFGSVSEKSGSRPAAVVLAADSGNMADAAKSKAFYDAGRLKIFHHAETPCCTTFVAVTHLVGCPSLT